MIGSPVVRIEPADTVSGEDLQLIFGSRGAAARCRCQRYRLEPGESFAGRPEEERARRLECQAGCADPGATTSGLVAWSGREPVGWCAVGPRRDLIGLVRVFTVPWIGRHEDRADPTVWSVSCVLVRAGHRRDGIGSALVGATVDHARQAGARALEGYPTITKQVIAEELHFGTLGMFARAGFEQVSTPTPRRAVVRIDYARRGEDVIGG